MPTSRRLLVFAMVVVAAFLSPGRGPADVAPAQPETVVITNLADFPDLVFVVYPVETEDTDGAQLARGVRLDPATAERHPAGLRLPPGLPVGELALLGVPRTLAEKTQGPPDPAWLERPAPGVVRVDGTIKTWRVQRHTAAHRYELEKTDAGLKLTLLNPDILLPYPAEQRGGGPGESQPPYLWLGLAAGALALAAGAWALWGSGRRSPRAGPGA